MSYSICLVKITEPTKTKGGQDSIYREGEFDVWLHMICAELYIFVILEKSSDPFFYPHCQLIKYANEIVKLKVVIESLSENLSSLQSMVMSPEQHTNEPMSTNIMSEPTVTPLIQLVTNDPKSSQYL